LAKETWRRAVSRVLVTGVVDGSLNPVNLSLLFMHSKASQGKMPKIQFHCLCAIPARRVIINWLENRNETTLTHLCHLPALRERLGSCACGGVLPEHAKHARLRHAEGEYLSLRARGNGDGRHADAAVQHGE
jgi:hypothetical protein